MIYALLLHLDGTHGDTATIDTSPSAHPITLNFGASLSSVQTKFGSTALSLDGVNDYLSAGPPYTDWTFGASQAFTVDFWIYLSSLPGADKPVIAIDQAVFSRWTVKIKSTGAIALEVYNGSPVPSVNISGGSISTGAWAHIALVRQTSGAINLYLDGTSVASTSYATALAGSVPIKAGSSIYPSPSYLGAYLDEIRVLIDEAAWTANFTPPSSAYAPLFDVEQEHGSLNAASIIEAEHGSLNEASIIEAEHGSLNEASIIEAEHSSLFSAWIEAEHGSPVTWMIEQEHGSINALLALTEAEHGSQLNLIAVDNVEAEHGSLNAAWIEAEHGSLYSLMALIEAEHGSLNNSTITVEQEHGSKFSLTAFDSIESEHGSLNRLGLADSFNVTNAAILYHNGLAIDIISANVKQDEGDPFWIGSIQLAKIADYAAMSPNDNVTLTMGADTYNLIVETKEKSRAFGQVNLSISVVSIGVVLTNPRATTITKTWPSIMAQSAAEDALGEAIDWQVMNWLIPDSRLSMVDAEPLEIARKIVEAIGGILQSKPDGSFIARPLFPISVPNWKTALPDLTLTDDTHNITANESYRYNDVVNMVTIQDTSGESTQDITEYIENETDQLKGKLYVWPRPWRPVIVGHTGHAAIGLTPLGVQFITNSELVEFKEGKASVSKPVYSIDSVAWQHVNLGAVSFAGTDLASAVAHYSMARIVYQTRCYVYDVSDTINETIQFLVMEQS